jgi:hypothetical protein
MAEPDYELNRTAGIRANGNKVFEIEFTGQKLYELLRILEERALESEHYFKVEQSVLMANYIRTQAKEQGF